MAKSTHRPHRLPAGAIPGLLLALILVGCAPPSAGAPADEDVATTPQAVFEDNTQSIIHILYTLPQAAEEEGSAAPGGADTMAEALAGYMSQEALDGLLEQAAGWQGLFQGSGYTLKVEEVALEPGGKEGTLAYTVTASLNHQQMESREWTFNGQAQRDDTGQVVRFDPDCEAWRQLQMLWVGIQGMKA